MRDDPIEKLLISSANYTPSDQESDAAVMLVLGEIQQREPSRNLPLLRRVAKFHVGTGIWPALMRIAAGLLLSTACASHTIQGTVRNPADIRAQVDAATEEWRLATEHKPWKDWSKSAKAIKKRKLDKNKRMGELLPWFLRPNFDDEVNQ